MSRLPVDMDTIKGPPESLSQVSIPVHAAGAQLDLDQIARGQANGAHVVGVAGE